MNRISRGVILGVLAVASIFVATKADATCVQCPTSPCEIAQCPPDTVPLFASIIVEGRSSSIGREEPLSLGGDIRVTSIEPLYGAEFSVGFQLRNVPVLPTQAKAIFVRIDAYDPNGQGGWTHHSTEIVEKPALIIDGTLEYPDPCLGRNVSCAEADCWNGKACAKSVWCPDGQDPQFGFCLTSHSVCGLISAECTCATPMPDCSLINPGWPINLTEFRQSYECKRAAQHPGSICIFEISDSNWWDIPDQ